MAGARSPRAGHPRCYTPAGLTARLRTAWDARAQMQDRLRSLKQWARNPREMGSITPSSRFLTRAVVERIDFSRARYIAELGPGTGVFTQAILERLAPDGQILAVDTNRSFIELLKR